jgi:plasmid stabilization system protein ParE
MQVVWSDDALIDYNQNIDYLLKEWSERVASEFVEDVEATIELINDFPELYPLTEYLGVRRAVVRKQITLFFKIKDEKIYLIRFWNNYQDPKKLRL